MKDNSSRVKRCTKCQKDFHEDCFRIDGKSSPNRKIINNKKSKIICNACEAHIINEMRTTKISDYFKASKNILDHLKIELKSKLNNKDEETSTCESNEECIKKKSKSCHKFRLPKPLKADQKKILEESLFRALKVKNIEFNDDLCYPDPECTADMNNASLEPGIQKISEYNRKTYYKFKEKTRNAEYPPVEVVDDEIQVKYIYIINRDL